MTMRAHTSNTRRHLQAFHQGQRGAILLLVLAGLMVLVICSLMMFDAGRSAHDKIRLQNATDSAAYSQSVVKARSMNMITYANTAKRMFYSYSFVYWAGFFNLLFSTGRYSRRCRWYRPYPCYRALIGGLQAIGEVINMLINTIPTLTGRASSEITTLDTFQKYLQGITPWWGYAENLFRGVGNGATITASWPPPPLSGTVADPVNTVMGVVDQIDGMIGFGIPAGTNATDRLPVQRRESASSHVQYCLEYMGSLDQIIVAIDHIRNSDGGTWTPLGISSDGGRGGVNPSRNFWGQMINPLNCLITSLFFGHDVLDWRVDDGGFMPSSLDDNDWAQRTSVITLAYQARDHSGRREAQFREILNDYDETVLYQTDGNWSLARSEIVFADTLSTHALGSLPGIGRVAGGMTSILSDMLAGPVVALRGPPHMWSPRWTPRLRPVTRPGETLQGNAGLGDIVRDTMPLILITGAVAAIVEDDLSAQNALRDMVYLFFVSRSYTGGSNGRMEGIVQ